MNKNELQVLIDYTKGMIADNKEPEKKVIVALCDELERITNLEPVAFARHTGMQRPLDLTVSHTVLNEWVEFNNKNPEIKDDIYPLFILD